MRKSRTIIHVNQHNIKANSKGENRPVLTCKTSKGNKYSNDVVILGQDGKEAARVIYSPNNPLACGAKVLNACIEAGISELPKETAEYFGSKYPEQYLLEEKLEIKIPKHEYSEDMTEGFEIIVSEIPEGVHKIRFVNSW